MDEAPPLPVADDQGNEMAPNTCPECLAEGTTRSFDKPVRLGAHRRGAHGVAGRADKKKSSAAGEEKASTVNVNFSAGKATGKGKDAALIAKTRQGATSFASMVGAGLAVMGAPDDGAIITARAAAWGEAMGDLSQYQPLISKIFAPTGAATGQAAAWAAVLLVTAGMVVPIAANHNLVKPELAATFGVVMTAASTTAGDIADTQAT